MARKGQENLIPASKRSLDEARKNGKKGGIASGKSRREKKDIKAFLKILLDSDLQTKDGKLMQGAERIATALFTMAANGDIRAIGKVFDVMYPQEQKIDLTSSDGSLVTRPTTTISFADLSPEERTNIARTLFTGK